MEGLIEKSNQQKSPKVPCKKCNGKGKVDGKKCSVCKGTGKIELLLD